MERERIWMRGEQPLNLSTFSKNSTFKIINRKMILQLKYMANKKLIKNEYASVALL